MLRTTPESTAETQPAVTPAGDVVLTTDARLDNRQELMTGFGFSGSDRVITDGELMLESYLRWGERCVERWVGDFAVVIWDSRCRGMFCVRDPFGVKPYYYHYTSGRLFAFASEVAALLCLEGISDEIDEYEVARHMLIPIEGDGSETYYRNVRRLLPGRAMVVTDDGVETRRYWSFDAKELRLASDEEYGETIREKVIEAVRCRLRSAGPIASMLSGGIDSASVTCVAADLLARMPESPPLHGLSAVYPGVPESDEREFINAVLERHQIVPHFFAADSADPIVEIDRMNLFAGGPIWGKNLYLNWELYGIAGQAGARVVLDGFDGDTTLSHGTHYITELALAGRWWKLAGTVIPFSRRRGSPLIHDYLSMVRFGLRERLGPTVLGNVVRGARGKRGPASIESPGRYVAVNPDFLRRFSVSSAARPILPTTERESHMRRLDSTILFEEIGWLDACAAGRGVEVRLPFCDVRLVGACLSLPPEQKIRRGWTRYVMRNAMQGVLPTKIQWRHGKANLNPGWARAWGFARNSRMEEVLTNPTPAMGHYLDMSRVRELHDRYLKGETVGEEGKSLWRALSLALWLSAREVQ